MYQNKAAVLLGMALLWGATLAVAQEEGSGTEDADEIEVTVGDPAEPAVDDPAEDAGAGAPTDDNDPCGDAAVKRWLSEQRAVAQESAAMARDIQNMDPNSAESLRRAEQEEALISTDACWGRTNAAVVKAAKGIYDSAKKGFKKLGDILSGDLGELEFPDIDWEKVACKVARGVDKTGAKGIGILATLPAGIERDARWAIWRNKRRAESELSWALRYAQAAPRRWRPDQLRGFVYKTRTELAHNYPDRPWIR